MIYFQAYVSLRAHELLNRLGATEKVNQNMGVPNVILWRPEYAAYMIEGWMQLIFDNSRPLVHRKPDVPISD